MVGTVGEVSPVVVVEMYARDQVDYEEDRSLLHAHWTPTALTDVMCLEMSAKWTHRRRDDSAQNDEGEYGAGGNSNETLTHELVCEKVIAKIADMLGLAGTYDDIPVDVL